MPKKPLDAMTVLWAAVPVVVFAGIDFTIYSRNLSYFETDMLYFWVPSAVLLVFHWKWLKAVKWGTPLVMVSGILYVVSFYFEFAGLGLNIWTFSKVPHAYLSLWIFTAPLEEFLFWFGAAPLCILLYLYYYRIFNKELQILEWAVMGAPFIGLSWFLFQIIKGKKVLNYPALGLTVFIFAASMGFVEKHAIEFKHWIFIPGHTLPIPLWGIPIEEFVIYYVFGPTCTIFLFHLFTLKPKLSFKDSPGANAMVK